LFVEVALQQKAFGDRYVSIISPAKAQSRKENP
jgi:hypothetical protein